MTAPKVGEDWGEAVTLQIRQWVDRTLDKLASFSKRPTRVVPVAIGSEDEAVQVARKYGLRAILWGTAEHQVLAGEPKTVIFNGNVYVGGNIVATGGSEIRVNTVTIATGPKDRYLVRINVTMIDDVDRHVHSSRLMSTPSLTIPMTLRDAWPNLFHFLEGVAAFTLLVEGRWDEAAKLTDRLGIAIKKGPVPDIMRWLVGQLFLMRGDAGRALAETDSIDQRQNGAIADAVRQTRMVAYWMLGQYEKGMAESEAALARLPNDASRETLYRKLEVARQRALLNMIGQSVPHATYASVSEEMGQIVKEASGTPHEGEITYVVLRTVGTLLSAAQLNTMETGDRETGMSYARWELALFEEATLLRNRCIGEWKDELFRISDDFARGRMLATVGRCSEGLPLLRKSIEAARGTLLAPMLNVGLVAHCVAVNHDGEDSSLGGGPWPQAVSTDRLLEALSLRAQVLTAGGPLAFKTLGASMQVAALGPSVLLAEAFARASSYPAGRGVLVISESKEGAAIHAGDLVMEYDGRQVDEVRQLAIAIRRVSASRRNVVVKILGGKATREISVARGELHAFVLLERGNVSEIQRPHWETEEGTVYEL